MSFYLYFSTVPNINEGRKIARILVENKLAACVNIIKDIFSLYKWKGEIQEDNEHLLLIKSTEAKCEEIIQRIKENHPYEEPECIAVKIERGSDTYLDWIQKTVE
ncbi:MAG: divalent-cation tolerance protein CutA [Candidatus Thorarchaeota archaeon]